MTNEQRAEQVIKKYGFRFNDIPKQEIIDLLQKEIANYQPGGLNISDYYAAVCIVLPRLSLRRRGVDLICP